MGLGAVRVRSGGTLQVFGTHMQAGAAKGVQAARKAQAEQAGDFVKGKRAKEGVVVLSGDFNMGPRGDEECKEFSVHYVDRMDAMARCEAYERLVQGAGVGEVECEQGRSIEGIYADFWWVG